MHVKIQRTESNLRVSTSQISVASSLYSTSDLQRGCVSQIISALGKDSCKPATAGNVWTISPREPRRTTRKRGSVMRRLANRIEEHPSRVILRIPHNGYANPKPRRCSPLRHSFRHVVRTLRVD